MFVYLFSYLQELTLADRFMVGVYSFIFASFIVTIVVLRLQRENYSYFADLFYSYTEWMVRSNSLLYGLGLHENEFEQSIFNVTKCLITSLSMICWHHTYSEKQSIKDKIKCLPNATFQIETSNFLPLTDLLSLYSFSFPNSHHGDCIRVLLHGMKFQRKCDHAKNRVSRSALANETPKLWRYAC